MGYFVKSKATFLVADRLLKYGDLCLNCIKSVNVISKDDIIVADKSNYSPNNQRSSKLFILF